MRNDNHIVRHRRNVSPCRRGFDIVIAVLMADAEKRVSYPPQSARKPLIEADMKGRLRSLIVLVSVNTRTPNGNRAIVRPPLGGVLAARCVVPMTAEFPRVTTENRAIVRTRAGLLTAHTHLMTGQLTVEVMCLGEANTLDSRSVPHVEVVKGVSDRQRIQTARAKAEIARYRHRRTGGLLLSVR